MPPLVDCFALKRRPGRSFPRRRMFGLQRAPGESRRKRRAHPSVGWHTLLPPVASIKDDRVVRRNRSSVDPLYGSFDDGGTRSVNGLDRGRSGAAMMVTASRLLFIYAHTPFIARTPRPVHEHARPIPWQRWMDVRTDSANTRAACDAAMGSHSSACRGRRRVVEHQHLARQEDRRSPPGGAGESSRAQRIRRRRHGGVHIRS